ncbi:MAG: diguanylate cyclase [Candidatus Aquicultor sp.]|nr:diguanylate cyclase [Candidatus Aquicultor sp.]
MEVCDVDGIQIIDSNGREFLKIGSSVLLADIPKNIPNEFKRSTIFAKSSNTLWIVAAEPIEALNGKTVAILVLSSKIGPPLLKKISREATAEIAIKYDALTEYSSNEIADFDNSRESRTVSSIKLVDFFRGLANSDLPLVTDMTQAQTSSGSKASIHIFVHPLPYYQAKLYDFLTTISVHVFLLLILIVAGYVMISNIVKPIRITAAQAKEIARGNYSHSIEYSGITELDDLVNSFNTMSDELDMKHKELEKRALTDGLTGLFNHRYFQGHLSVEFKRASRFDRALSLLIIDIDDFKRINDTFGHTVGDNALASISAIIKDSLRETDVACRIGGEEFAVILSDTDTKEAFVIAEKLRLEVASHPFEKVGRITVSLGIATYPDHAMGKESLLEAADTAMYKAKRSGKNQSVAYLEEYAEPTVRPESKAGIDGSHYIGTLGALAAAVDAKDCYTRDHSSYVAAFAALIGAALSLPIAEIEHLRIAGLLHDIGTIGIPDNILNKPGSLTDEEFDVVEMHPIIGEQILTKISLDDIVKATLYHHERLDGSGYPCGLTGEEIPLYARILAVADSFDAMTSNRPYRKALSIAEAINELRNDSTAKLDPYIVDALIRIVENDEAVRNMVNNRNDKSTSESA